MKKNYISPFAALISLVVYSVFIAFCKHLYLSMVPPLIFLVVIYRTYLFSVFKKLLLLNALVLLVVITLVLQHEYAIASLIFLRSNLILLFGLLLFCDKDEFSIALGMHELKMPKRFVSIVFFTTKSIFLLKREWVQFKKTLLARGFQFKTNALSYHVLAGGVGILVIKAIQRASALQKAMIIRHFNGTIYTLNPSHRLSVLDSVLWILVAFSILIKQGVIL